MNVRHRDVTIASCQTFYGLKELKFYDALLVITATCCCLFALIVWLSPKSKSTEKLLIVVYFVLIGLIQLIDLLFSARSPAHLMIEPLAAALGPVFYCYIVYKIKPRKIPTLSLGIWFSPAMILLGLNLLRFIDWIPSGWPSHQTTLLLIAPIELIYVLLAYRVIRLSNQQQDPKSYSAQLVQFLTILCLINGAALILDSTGALVTAIFAFDLSHHRAIANLLMVLFLMILMHHGIRQPQLLFSAQLLGGKYKNSGMNTSLSEHYRNKLMALLEKEKPYTNNELSLRVLADLVGLSLHNLSQLLNETFGMSYHEFISEKRVEYAKRLMHSTDKSILEIGFDAGFNSKVAFYNAFKKQENVTPGQWRKEHAIDHDAND